MAASNPRAPQALPSPSSWVARFALQIPKDGPVLDLACGKGRHLRLLLAQGFEVIGVDRDTSEVADLAGPRCRILEADLEGGAWPLGEQRFAGVIVTNYLHRPLATRLVGALAEGGVLLYETFEQGQERLGRPSNPDFLLAPGELLQWAAEGGLQVVAYESGLTIGSHGRDPMPAGIEDPIPDASSRQRLCAVRGPSRLWIG